MLIKSLLRLIPLLILISLFSVPLSADESTPPGPSIIYDLVLATDPGLAFPIGVALDLNDNIFLTTLSPNWGQVFNQAGEKIGQLDYSGIDYLQNMLDTYTTGFTIGPDGRLYLSEHRINQDSRVHIFNPDFTYQKSLPSRVDHDPGGNGYFPIQSIAVDSNNQLYVAYPDEIEIFDSSNLQHVDTLDISGSSVGISPDDTLYIYNEGIQKFSSEHIYLETFDFGNWYQNNIGPFYGDIPQMDVMANGLIAITMADPSQILFFDSEFNHAGTIGTGERGNGNDEIYVFFYSDSVVEVNSSGEILVVDSGNQRIQIFDSEFNYSRTLDNINPNYQLLLGRHIRIGEDNRIYVAGTENEHIKVYSKDLEYIDTIEYATTPTGSWGFGLSSQLVVDSDGRLYVTTESALLVMNPDYSLIDRLDATDFEIDPGTMSLRYIEHGNDGKFYIFNAERAFDGSGTIYVFDSELTLESSFSTESVGIPPIPDSSATGFDIGQDGKIYLAYSDSIIVINQERNGYTTLGGDPESDENTQFYRVYDVTIGLDNKIYVTDQGNNRIQVFSPDLEYLATIGNGYGDELGQLALPFSIDVDENGWVYVLDTLNSRIQLFTPNIRPTTQPDTYNIITNETLTTNNANGVLANDIDPEAVPLTATSTIGPSHAISFIFNTDGSFTYVPETDFNGQDSFTYQANDGTLSSIETTVTINITAPEPTETATATESETPTETETATATDTETATDTPEEPTAEVTSIVTPEATMEITPEPTNEITPEPTDEVTPIVTAEPGTEPPSAPQNLSIDPRQGRPQITWSDDVQAQWFHIYIGSSDYTLHLLDAWIQRDEYCEASVCSVIPPIDPLAGSYHVWMQAWGYGEYSTGGDSGYSGWSYAEFTLPNTPPQAVTGMTVTSAEENVTFSWAAPTGATWYNIWLGTGSPDWTPYAFTWLGADDLGCGAGGSCRWENLTLPGGSYVWYVKAWGPGGFSTGGMVDAPGWSQGPGFTVPK